MKLNILLILWTSFRKIPEKLLFENIWEWVSVFALSVMTMYVVPLNMILTALYLLIILDFVFGSWSSIKKNGWRSFSYRGVLETIGKFFAYTFMLIAVFIFQKMIMIDNIAVYTPIFLAAGMIGFAEIKSIIGHFAFIYNINLMGIFDLIKLPWSNKAVKSDNNDPSL